MSKYDLLNAMQMSDSIPPSQNKKDRWSRNILFLTLGFSMSLCAFVALIMPVVAIGAACFSALGFLFLFEHIRREAWEKSATFRFLKLELEGDILRKNLLKNKGKIESLLNKADVILHRRRQHIKKIFRRAADAMTENTINAKSESRTITDSYTKEIPPSATTALTNKAPLEAEEKVTKESADIHPAKTPLVANDEHPSYYNSLSDTVVKELVQHAVSNKDVAVFMQPVMRLPERVPRGYEVFSRIRSRPGQYIPAERYIDLARQDNVINKVDHLLLMQCLEQIKRTSGARQNTVFFINITAQTLKNKPFMNRLLAFISVNRSLAQRIVFEISQKDFNELDEGIGKILIGLGRLECTFSLDHVENLHFDVNMLKTYKVRFIKVDAEMLVQKSTTPGKRNGLKIIKRNLEKNGIGIIAQKIEHESTLHKLGALSLHYGQGYLFGKPGIDNIQAA